MHTVVRQPQQYQQQQEEKEMPQLLLEEVLAVARRHAPLLFEGLHEA